MQEWELSEYSEELSGFYRSSFAGVKLLKTRLERYQKMDDLLYSVLSHLVDLYEVKNHSVGKWVPMKLMILKSLPVLLYLLSSQNSKLIEKKGVARAVALLKRNPILPVLGDAWMSAFGLLSTLDGFDSKFRIRPYLLPHEISDKHLQGTEMGVSICSYVENVRPVYSSVLFDLCKCISQAQKVGLEANVIPNSLADLGLEVYRKALDLAHSCQWHLQSFFYWKVSSSSTGQGLSGQFEDESLSNKIVGIFNDEEKLSMLTLVQILKNLNQYIVTREYLLFPVLNAAIQKRLNIFEADTLAQIRLSKRCPDSFARLYNVLTAYLPTPSGKGTLQLGRGPSMSQLLVVNEIVSEMCSEIDHKQRKTKIFKKDVSSSTILGNLQSFLLDSMHFVLLLGQGFSLSEAGDASYLWLHEQLFDKMQENKSSIETSLPWKLFASQIEINRKDLDFETSLILMHIYNKTAAVNLTRLGKQYIYDELEMETDLAYERMAFKIATKIYDTVKMTVSGQHLSKFISADVLKNDDLLPKQSILGIISPKVHNLLGRNVNFRKMIAQRINKMLRENLDYLMERFEALDISQGILEFHTGYHILEATHSSLCEVLTLDSWETISKEMNESTSTLSFGSRLCVYIYKELASSVPSHYNYYLSASKFIEDKNAPRRDQRKNPLPVLPSPTFLFGHKIFNETIREISKMHSGTFSSVHFQCLAQLLDGEEVFLVVQKLIEKSYKLISNSILPNIKDCMEVMDESIITFEDIESVDKDISNFDPILKVFAGHHGDNKIFEELKVFGNIMFTIYHLSNVENVSKNENLVFSESVSHGLSILKACDTKGLDINGTTFNEGDIAFDHESKAGGCRSLLSFSIQSLKKLFEEERFQLGSQRRLTSIFNSICVSFCKDNKGQVQNLQTYGDSVPFALMLLSHVLEVIKPFHMLECLHVLKQKEEDLPMHMQLLVENAAKFYECVKAFSTLHRTVSSLRRPL